MPNQVIVVRNAAGDVDGVYEANNPVEAQKHAVMVRGSYVWMTVREQAPHYDSAGHLRYA